MSVKTQTSLTAGRKRCLFNVNPIRRFLLLGDTEQLTLSRNSTNRMKIDMNLWNIWGTKGYFINFTLYLVYWTDCCIEIMPYFYISTSFRAWVFLKKKMDGESGESSVFIKFLHLIFSTLPSRSKSMFMIISLISSFY